MGEAGLGQPTVGRIGIAERTFSMVETPPPRIFYVGAIGAIIASLGLFLSGKRLEAIFVGHWAPTFLAFGLYSKLMRQPREM